MAADLLPEACGEPRIAQWEVRLFKPSFPMKGAHGLLAGGYEVLVVLTQVLRG